MSKKVNDIIPLGSQVLIELDEREAMKGSIHIPEQAKYQPQTGIIMAIGPATEDDDPKGQLQVGERAIFSRYGGNKVEIDGKDHNMLMAQDIWGIVKAKEVDNEKESNSEGSNQVGVLKQEVGPVKK